MMTDREIAEVLARVIVADIRAEQLEKSNVVVMSPKKTARPKLRMAAVKQGA